MNLTKNFKNILTQSLLDSYNVQNLSMEKIKGNGYIRYELKGYVGNNSFLGSLNLCLQIDGQCDFSVTGWFDNDHRSFSQSITKNNAYLQSIKEVGDLMFSSFGRRIETQFGRFWIGSGSFLYNRLTISDVNINMTPSSNARLKIVAIPGDNAVDLDLLDYSFFVKDAQSHFNYRTRLDHALCSPLDVEINHVDLEQFKKRLVRQYMLAFSELTDTPNLLSVEDFNTLSYQHIIDYLTVQQMQDIH